MPYKNNREQYFYNHDYYLLHKERITEQRKGTNFCEACRKSIRKTNIAKHSRTRSHILEERVFKEKRMMGEVLKRKIDGDIVDIILSFL